MLFGVTPSYAYLKGFGCLCYAHAHNQIKAKFDERSTTCIFFSYPHGQKGWRVYDMANKQIFVSRDVVFCENIFPYDEMVGSQVNQVNEQWGTPLSLYPLSDVPLLSNLIFTQPS